MVAKKKVGRPAKKAVDRPAKKSPVGRPAKKTTTASSVAKLLIRVIAIENKIEQAERAGAKIHADLQKWRETSAPKWKSRQPADGKPYISHARVKVMRRDGMIVGPFSVDYFSWGELGDATIIAYAVV
jgi:hypothetical protein